MFLRRAIVNGRTATGLGVSVASIALAVLASSATNLQVSGTPFVRLQPQTPGTQQAGHANVSGTMRAGSVRTGGFRLGASATAGHVLTADASGVGTWQQAPASGLVLPYSGMAASAGAVFAIGNTGTGPGVHGQHASGQSGDLGSSLAGVYGQGGTGVLGAGDVYGVRGNATGGGIAVFGVHSGTGNLGLFADSVYGAYGKNTPTGNFGYLGDYTYGAYAENGQIAHVGHLAGPDFGAYGLSVTDTGAGVRGVSENPSGPAFGVHGSSISIRRAAAGVHGHGNGAAGPGLPRAAAILANDGAITVAGPILNRASGTIEVFPGFLPLVCCNNEFAELPHFHEIGHSIDITLLNNLILPGPPNVGSMIMATVETVPGPPPAKTSYYVQVYNKLPGLCTFRLTRMGTPDPAGCPPPAEINYIHYIIINPENSL